MTADFTEQQQLEHIRQWIKKHGLSSLGFFLLFFLAGMGWHFWQKHQEIKYQRASVHYETLLDAVVNDHHTVTLKEARLLKNNYVHTPYAALAALMMARSYVHQSDYFSAESELRWVISHASSVSLREVARLRLARLYLQEKTPQKALDLLQKTDDPVYAPLIHEMAGDSFYALGQHDKALQAYQDTLKLAPDYARMRPLFAIKFEHLAASAQT